MVFHSVDLSTFDLHVPKLRGAEGPGRDLAGRRQPASDPARAGPALLHQLQCKWVRRRVAAVTMRRALLRLLVLLAVQPGRLQLGEARISGFHIDYELCSGQLSGTPSSKKILSTSLDFCLGLALVVLN